MDKKMLNPSNIGTYICGLFTENHRNMRSEKKPWSPLLYDELIEEILSRLPVKPLIQFKYVCKGWNSLMSDPYFIKLHLSKSAAKDDLEHLQLMKNVCLGSIPEIHMESCDVSS